MSSSRQDQKNERLLRELLKQPANKRCPNCDSIGPQYVVSGFNIFVCTVCSGVHRQFGHRVKGVSMSTFKKEEVEALQAAGNGLFAAHYLAKWTQAQLPKPTDRNPDRIREWIQAVYEGKRFFDGDKQYTQPPAVLQSKSTSEGKEVLVRHLSDVLGVDKTPKLVVERTDSLERSPAARVPSVGGARSSLAGGAVNLLDISSPKAAVAAPSPKAAAAPPQEWDAFGASSAAGPPGVAAQGATDGWAAFGDSPAVAAPAAVVAVSNPLPPQPMPATSNGTWEAFGDAAASSIANGAPASPAPAKVEPPPQQQQPPKKDERKEVPLDTFFPEFEQIRATGLLPNGQPAPVPVRPQQYGFAGIQQAYAPGLQAYGGAAAAGYGYQAGVGTGVPPRPTVLIPAAPLYPTGVAPSPAGMYAPSPGAYGAPAYSPQGVISPAGSTGSGPVAYVNGAPAYGRMDSLGSGTPSEPSPPAAQQHDPFAALAPGFKAALPSYGSGSVRQSPGPAAAARAQYTAAAEAAGYASAAPSPVPTPTTGSPFGSSSLFGGPPSLAAMPYDLSAPAAPKPKASGNPFA